MASAGKCPIRVLCAAFVHTVQTLYTLPPFFSAGFARDSDHLWRTPRGECSASGKQGTLKPSALHNIVKENHFLAKEPLKFRPLTAPIIHARSEFVKTFRANLCTICE